jgi:hypothetical protein
MKNILFHLNSIEEQKAGKDAYEKFTEFESVGKIILSEEENLLIREISTNVLINPELYNQIADSNYGKICYVIDKKQD